MWTLNEIRELAKQGVEASFHNGVYSLLIRDGKVLAMSPSCWDPRPLWDPYVGILPSDGWKRYTDCEPFVKTFEEEEEELEDALAESIHQVRSSDELY